jgi:hypothetical protein
MEDGRFDSIATETGLRELPQVIVNGRLLGDFDQVRETAEVACCDRSLTPHLPLAPGAAVGRRRRARLPPRDGAV